MREAQRPLLKQDTRLLTLDAFTKEETMKRPAFLLIFALLLLSFNISQSEDKNLKGNITLSGAWAIYPTAVEWASEFQKKYPEVKVDVSAGGAGKGAADAIAGLVDIGMVSRDPDPSEIQKGIIPIYVLHDAVYPIVSEKNPVLNELLKKGIKRSVWKDIYINSTMITWDKVAGSKTGKTLHVYTRSDSCGAAASWAKYVDNKKQEDLKGVGVYGDPGLIEAVKRDPIGIGYTNFGYVFDRQGAVLGGIKIVPIDVNNDGLANPDEVFGKREEAVKAIRESRYPATRKNYFFVKGKPQGLVKSFIEFILSDEGTQVVEKVGTSLPLLKEDRAKALKSIQ